ncbi:quinol dehydrogenase ferredoxin subunit NapH [Castellaniella defragrans]|uniref:Ferredoxin-type protein NapH n=1 Tax=Castellaniella defragrans TaxID=75697 RepID=A0A7W9TLT3_CASDE|nr:quinol dehydrogenase ferredoxin subunit NapH [Castellaniella defragrans]KAB0608864.1 quinol dehydrogenase ferredoxin subunit NapH [Castellaniella defragrans]MBB6083050.1 ferredoxin-type protein NapH [Castellaniella defragrans]
MLEKKKFLLLRRVCQGLILAAFALGSWLGVPLASGTLASSVWFGTVPLSDPFVLLQSLAAGHPLAGGALWGGFAVLAFYALVGGRAFCGWVCPVNLVTDAAQGLRRALGWRKARMLRIDKRLRYAVLALALLGSAAGGVVLWEAVNPINLIMRALVFGLWLGGLTAALGIFLFDFLALSNGWCGHVCPVGVFYGAVGRHAVVRVAAVRRDACNDCGDCFAYCPEPQVISPALRAIDGHGVGIDAIDCLRCGRCIDVCEQRVFEFSVAGRAAARFPADSG